MVVVRAERGAVQRARGDDEAVVRLLGLPAEARDLGRERGQAVGLVAAQVRDAAQTAGESAIAARAAMVGASSPASWRSTSIPRTSPVPVTAMTPSVSSARPPIAVRSSAIMAPGWVVAAGQPGTRTVPPTTRAAARNGPAFDRSGST